MHLYSLFSLLHFSILMSFFLHKVRSTYPTPDETTLLSVRFHSYSGTNSPGDQITLWYYVDESKSQLFQVVSQLRYARLSRHFERPAHYERAHFTSIQFETDRKKRGVPSEKAPVLLFGGRLAAARKPSDPPKKTHMHTRTHTETSMRMNTCICTVTNW